MEFKRGGVLFTEWKEGGEAGEDEVVVEFVGEEDVELYRDSGYVRGLNTFKVDSGKSREVGLRIGIVEGECEVVVKLNPVLVKLGMYQASKEKRKGERGWIWLRVYCGEVKKEITAHGIKSKKSKIEYALGRVWEVGGKIEVDKDFPLAQVEFKGIKKVFYRVRNTRS